jgi:hypothetical protein
MPSFIVNTGVTDTVAKTVSNNDTGTIQSGGKLSDGTDITWSGGAAGNTVTINNSGTITATARGIVTSTSFTQPNENFSLFNNQNALLTASNDAFQIALTGSSATNFSGTITVSNFGTIQSTNNGQAIDFGNLASPSANIIIKNTATGTIHAQGDDAIRPGSGHITIINGGLIDSTTSATARSTPTRPASPISSRSN